MWRFLLTGEETDGEASRVASWPLGQMFMQSIVEQRTTLQQATDELTKTNARHGMVSLLLIATFDDVYNWARAVQT